MSNYKEEYFTIEALETGLTAKLGTNACEYRIDNGAWATLSANTNTSSINKGQKLQFRANITSNTSAGIGSFTISKKCNISGNIMSLLYGDNFVNKTDLTSRQYVFYRLFMPSGSGNPGIISAKNLILPATTLANYCYQQMFSGCKGLTSAPSVLPATTLKYYCYSNMFYGCTSLTAVPELPATTLNNYCYESMFENCTSLTTAPELPATKLNSYCYDSMFSGCTSLITAPELPATTLASGCYYHMFSGCTSLITAPSILPVTTLADHCCSYMFLDCTSLTTAPELPATTLDDYCYLCMFKNCTSLTTVPELPAMTLAEGCYDSMFYNCTSLTKAPMLLASYLPRYCYQYMFYGCSNLNYIKMLSSTGRATDALKNWVYGVSSTGTFFKNYWGGTLATGVDGIPEGWTVVPDNYKTATKTYVKTKFNGTWTIESGHENRSASEKYVVSHDLN